ncbi:MAG: methyltransferase domain-containing protein [candidate division Zixibacteria bacterium]|nr:methyltransferase domain-containing protein [candidate division Zixibacteria bacterium]
MQCPVCGTGVLKPFFRLPEMPVICNNLWNSRDSARNCPKGDIALGFCNECGFIRNLKYKSEDCMYSIDYENSLHFSDRFQEYIRRVATHLIEDYGIKDKTVIEIGCGKGDFLLMLCREGHNKGIGFDQSYVDLPQKLLNDVDITFIKDYYFHEYKSYRSDLICCRHVLEHLDDPLSSVKEIRDFACYNDGVKLYYEVPNSLHTFKELAVLDIIYEHPNYFTPVSLKSVFELAGFEVLEQEQVYGNQFINLIAAPSSQDTPHSGKRDCEVRELRKDVGRFEERFKRFYEDRKKLIEDASSQNCRAVIWGTGSKGVTFLNLFKDQNLFEYAVDINPRKESKFVSGSGQKIVSPKFLRDYDPDLTFIMNPIYETEIAQTIQEMGIAPELIVV